VESVTQPVNSLNLGGQKFGIQAMGHRYPLGMVSDGQVCVALFLGCLGHLLQAVAAVRILGTNTEVAPDVRQGNQLRQPSLLGRLHFTPILAQFRLNIGQADQFKALTFFSSALPLLIPYSVIFSPFLTPILRTAMLWALEPVK